MEKTPQTSTIRKQLRSFANKDIAEHSLRFFKTGEGEYGAGDKFLGLRVPVLREHVKLYKHAPLEVVEELLSTGYHEERLFALFLWVKQFPRASDADKKNIYTSYLAHTDYINNWDLVDASAHHIVGAYLEERSRAALYKLSQSNSLWERRIAMMACFHFIRKNDFEDALRIAELLLDDAQDLIHKVVGWMLREIGKRDFECEQAFLQQYYRQMPRTMLRYAIEKHPEKLRQAYLKGEVNCS
ncbi:3-methyladenine DNA glycosylase AlkD [Alteromonadaceae bacterium Bs31]|nr:3-methyladenine DNA glycosylase AlkD [Alteromonadaceae bacterium Bs31]